MTSPAIAAKPYHHGNLRAKLLETAIDIIREEGVEAVTLRALAARIGVSHAAPYRHFASKRALLAAIATEGFRLMLDSQREWLDQSGADPLSQVRATGIAYIDFAQKFPEHFRIMFGREVGPRNKFPELQAASTPTFMAVVEGVRECQAAGIMRTDSATNIAMMLWAAVHGLTILAMDKQIPLRLGDDREMVRSVGRVMTDAITEGFLAADAAQAKAARKA